MIEIIERELEDTRDIEAERERRRREREEYELSQADDEWSERGLNDNL